MLFYDLSTRQDTVAPVMRLDVSCDASCPVRAMAFNPEAAAVFAVAAGDAVQVGGGGGGAARDPQQAGCGPAGLLPTWPPALPAAPASL